MQLQYLLTVKNGKLIPIAYVKDKCPDKCRCSGCHLNSFRERRRSAGSCSRCSGQREEHESYCNACLEDGAVKEELKAQSAVFLRSGKIEIEAKSDSYNL